ncbi:MAG: biotin--[acetyl-CoA-carboxylase] ligase [Halolamina sp.]
MTDTRDELLAALAAADDPVPGPTLAEQLSVSRAAVWNHVEALREAGFGVESGPEGYRLRTVPTFGGRALALGLDAPYEVEFHESLASTNDRARELAADGAAEVVVVAERQTGGRGRLDREWTAPPGGVYASTVLRPDRPPAHVPAFTLAAAVATTRACREAGVDARIKWPNDVVVPDADAERGGRKLAGILTEMEGEADRVSWLVVGVGVNADVEAASLPAGATSLADEAGDVDRRAFTQRLLESFHDLTADLDAVLPAWREHALTLGRRVRVETPGGIIEGDAVDVTFPGALVVATDDGREVVHAGDCEHLRPAE